MIALKIDLNKVDQSRLFIGKNGAKWLDVVLIDSPNNQYGNDYMVCQSVSKEEREAGVKGAILGNGKKLGGQRPAERSMPTPPRRREQNLDEDVPW